MVVKYTQDSLTRCNPELYDNIYQTVKRPDLKVQNTPHLQVVKDTLERSASAEALNRLQRPSENMVFQPNVLFRRIGKYLFLTVAMPPYFLLYGLPKWLLVESFQILTVAMAWLTKEIKQKTEKPLNLIIQKTNQLIFFMQMIAKRIIKPVAELGIQLRQFFQGMAYKFQNINKQIFSKVKEGLKRPSKGLKKPFEFAKNLIEQSTERWTKTKSKMKNQALFFNEKIEGSVNWIKQAPAIFLGWGNAQIQNLNNSQWPKKLGSKFRASSKVAQTCSDWTGKQLNLLKDLVKKGLAPLTGISQKFLKPFSQRLSKNFSFVANKFSGFLNDRKKQAFYFVEAIQSKVKALTPQQALEKLLPTSFLVRLPTILRKILLKIKENPLTHAIIRLTLKGLSFVVIQMTTLFKKVIEGISTLHLKLSHGLISFKNKIQELTRKTIITINTSLSVVQKGCKNGLHGFLVVIFMSVILLKWGFESLGEITLNWTSKLSFSAKKNR